MRRPLRISNGFLKLCWNA
ncbi:hypothetical protein LINPERPRIM_LOCUS29955 [Linum perenne]